MAAHRTARASCALALCVSIVSVFAASTGFAAKSGCDYWDRFTTEEVEARLDGIRARWLAIQPTRAEIAAAREEELKTIAGLGYKNPRRFVDDLDDDFFIRRIRLKRYRETHGENYTDEELWIYCVNGRDTPCSRLYDSMGGPPAFDASGALAEPNDELRAMLDQVRTTVAEFNLFAQMSLSYCACDGSEEAVALCDKAWSYLMRDF